MPPTQSQPAASAASVRVDGCTGKDGRGRRRVAVFPDVQRRRERRSSRGVGAGHPGPSGAHLRSDRRRRRQPRRHRPTGRRASRPRCPRPRGASSAQQGLRGGTSERFRGGAASGRRAGGRRQPVRFEGAGGAAPVARRRRHRERLPPGATGPVASSGVRVPLQPSRRPLVRHPHSGRELRPEGLSARAGHAAAPRAAKHGCAHQRRDAGARQAPRRARARGWRAPLPSRGRTADWRKSRGDPARVPRAVRAGARATPRERTTRQGPPRTPTARAPRWARTDPPVPTCESCRPGAT
jgi:hypothetical protein